MIVTTQVASPPSAGAASLVTVRVVIEHVLEQGCTDSLSGSDFYARTVIDGTTTNFGEIDGEDEISPNWTAEKQIDVDATSSVPVKIELAESDGFLNFGDDDCDIDPDDDDLTLDLTVTLIPCSVSGDQSGVCALPITTTGNDEGDGDADLRFRVEVDLPAATPGLAVRCTHTPLWPQPGQNVTVTVESLDGTVQLGDTMVDLSDGPPGSTLVDHKKIADDLEIWVNETTGPDLDVQNKTTDSFVVNNVAAGDLLYGCVVKDGPDKVFTGWRRVRVGPPAEGKAIPVSYTGDRTNRVDVIFIADMDDYDAVNNATFLSHAGDVIKGSYYGQDYFLANQQRMNFWLADQRGDADEVPAPTPTDPSATRCVLTPPLNWTTDYSWRDAGPILHAATFRDCASWSQAVFSAEPTSFGTVLHETGHAAFGLADEYCCDAGYVEPTPDPNLYDTSAECQADAPNLGRTAAACRSFVDTRPNPDKTWFTSEPSPNDLMNLDRHPPQAADLRRMNGIFNNCKVGKC